MSLPDRRTFIKKGTLTAAAIPIFGSFPYTLNAADPVADISIGEVVDRIISQIPGGKLEDTVDTLKTGQPDWNCTGVVSTFLATSRVVNAANELNANLIITHEPTFYNHPDEVDWLKDDPVYLEKKRLLEENNIAVWRFHDYWHRYKPDGILHGVLDKIGWLENLIGPDSNICKIESTTLSDLAVFLKRKLELSRTFYVGSPNLVCRNVALLPGAWGRNRHIEALQREDVDVIAIGEAAEWETIEYVRDAADMGFSKGLVILGHADSEEPGMKYAAEWLKDIVPEVPAYHLPAGDPFVGV